MCYLCVSVQVLCVKCMCVCQHKCCVLRVLRVRQHKCYVLCVLCVCQHKCEQYWPDSGEKKYGTVTVTMLGTRRTADYVIRTLQLAKVSVHVIAAAMTSERFLAALL